ncbi:hypothetical protein ETB97_004987 [Aspergillus alliaceus]|uniref:AAA+ ATPase domain-containing protein n=1 Tax=Petromyces alliaceus TaxID=209559 RepID=A0A8H6E4D8_PETAA|nr:hypothetical protein ETB97_004987 [Aspergillus burnettii]
MYTEDIRAVSPGIVLLEEAGEILESHVLAAINSETKQLVLIGDHQQLRPKINNYALSVEKGDGYDLNRSLFERLVLAGYPHSTLAKQHRMCPEISFLVRSLTYPDLEDAPATFSRPAPRGLQDRVIFFHHENPETKFAQVSDRRDEGTKESKTNPFEVEVVLKIVKYLGQQGYGTDKVVVLTPYLGQLHLLRDRLKKDNDPVLNDLDSHDLVKAGLLSQASADHSKRAIRLSTIDNYQGEECEVVISILTRSNNAGDIGFMAAPQRLNVLLSRARNVLIMVGNVKTFINSRKGKDVWTPFVNNLKEKGHFNGNSNVNVISSSTHPLLSTKKEADKAVKNNPAQPVPPEPMPDNLSAKDEWDYQKQFLGARSDSIDKLMAMIGLEQVKDKFLTIKTRVDTALRQGVDMSKERFGSVLIGNPGTVARLYANFLGAVGVLPGSYFVETSGSILANEGVPGCQKKINTILNSGGGVLFIDEAYQLTEGQTQGAQVMNFLLAEVENQTGKMAVVLAGYRTHMEKFFAHNPGLPSRFPHEFKFEDYTDNELLQIFEFNVNQTYQNRMKLEGGMGGLYSRIVSRRIGRGRGNEGFGNARAIQNVCSRIYDRQATQLKRERKKNASADDMLLTKEDLIGPEPSEALQNCTAWQKLQRMIGLDIVKKSIKAFLDSIQYNYHRELEEKPLVEFTLNRVFLGSPGTGKTKKNTKGILASTVGKVLVIDEAYGLFGGGTKDKMGSQTNQFKTAVVDTIVAEIQSTPGDDRCVLLLGYKDQMEEMFQNVNPGLTRRFPLDTAFTFHDFTDDEMGQIFDLKLRQQGFDTTSLGRKVAMDVLRRSRDRSHFGNAGEIDILLNRAKLGHQKRINTGQSRISSTFLPEDFDEDYDRGQHAEGNVTKLFQGTVGCDKIIAQMEEYCRIVHGMRVLDLDPRTQAPFNFLFRGPPGTGKTTTARKIGQLYYSMNLLSTTEVIESWATDLVGQYIGQTGPKTQEVLEKSLGKVLLIDEAYRLAEGQFAKEAIDEIVACITHPKYAQKLIIILAGYEEDINRLMDINPGLTSRFPESIVFHGLDPNASITLLITLLRKQRDTLREKGKEFNIGILEHLPADLRWKMHSCFEELCQTPNWANARDIQDLTKKIFAKVIQNIGAGRVVLTESDILTQMGQMVKERSSQSRVGHSHAGRVVNHLPIATDTQDTAEPRMKASVSTSTTTATNIYTLAQSPDPDPNEPITSTPNTTVPRDAGVSDEIWNELQLDKLKAQQSEQVYHHLLQDMQTFKDAFKQQHKTAEDNSANDSAIKRAYEKERLHREIERRAQEEELERLRKKKAQIEEQRRKEAQTQRKLRQMGVCVMGYRWIKQSGGYRCAGGSHWVSDAQLDI